MKSTIVLVDDHKLFRDGIKFVLNQMKDIEVIGEAADGKEFLELLEDIKPDMVLMDISLPEIDGIKATQKAIEKYPDLKVMALSMYCDQEYYIQMIQAGAQGFVLKESGMEELETAIKSILGGDHFFSQKLLHDIVMNMNKPEKTSKPVTDDSVKLTKRELEVLKHICNGLSNAEIADKLFLSVRTVEGHKSNLINKTGVKNTISLVMYALKNKLVEV